MEAFPLTKCFLLQSKCQCLLWSETQNESGKGKNQSALWSCVIVDLLSSVFLKAEALASEILTFSLAVFFSLLLSHVLLGWASSCPVGVGLSLLLPIFFFFFFWRWKLTKASKALQARFLPLLIDFMLQLSLQHTHTHTNDHTLSCKPSSKWLSHTQGTTQLEASQAPSLNLSQRSHLLWKRNRQKERKRY